MKKIIKSTKLISLILAIVSIFSICSIPVSAQESNSSNNEPILSYPATFPILINGYRWDSPDGPVVINGRTYLSLQAIGSALNIPVIWNEQLHQVEIINDNYKNNITNNNNNNNNNTNPTTPTTNTSNNNSSKKISKSNSDSPIIKTIKQYLKKLAFSEKSLIDQLVYDGYPKSEASEAIDSLDIDWNEQAVKWAKDFLDYYVVSNDRIYDLLEEEGFDDDQINYAIKELYGNERYPKY